MGFPVVYDRRLDVAIAFRVPICFMHSIVNLCIKEYGMRTTLDLPETLLQEAMKLSHQRTKTGVIVDALEEYIRKNKIQGLKKFRGRVCLDIDMDTLRKRP